MKAGNFYFCMIEDKGCLNDESEYENDEREMLNAEEGKKLLLKAGFIEKDIKYPY